MLLSQHSFSKTFYLVLPVASSQEARLTIVHLMILEATSYEFLIPFKLPMTKRMLADWRVR